MPFSNPDIPAWGLHCVLPSWLAPPSREWSRPPSGTRTERHRAMRNDSQPDVNDTWAVIRDVPPRPSYRRLCVSCRHAGHCVYERERGRRQPSFFCEEFEIDSATSDQRGPSCASPSAVASRGDGDAGVFIGLCGNCRNRKTCVSPKPEGGIWHCEEYEVG